MVRQELRDADGLVSSRVELYESTPKKFQGKSAYSSIDSFTSPKVSTSAVPENKKTIKESPLPYVGSALIESGIQHLSRQEHEQALKAFNVALNIQRVSLGSDEHICIAHTYSCIGSVFLKQGQIVHAKKQFEKVLTINENIRKQVAPVTDEVVIATTLNNLGNVACLAGDFNSSLMHYRQALQDLRQKESTQKSIADVLYNIGRIQLQKKEFDTAMSNLTESCRITKDLYGRSHQFHAQTLCLIGMVQLSTSSLSAAMNSFTEAHNIFMELNGDIHADVASSWYHIGLVREAQGFHKEAWEAFTKSRDIYSRLGADQNDDNLKTIRMSIARAEKLISQIKSKPYDF